MLRKLLIHVLAGTAFTLSTTAFAQGQAATSAEVTCRPLSDDAARRFITERHERLVNGSGIECKD
jgi:hypothetical protein